MNKGEKRSKAEFDILGRIREERDKRGWTDYELCENAGISQSTLSTWNKRNIEPGIASIEKICSGLGISLSQFFSSSNEMSFTKDQEDIINLWLSLSPSQRDCLKQLILSFID